MTASDLITAAIQRLLADGQLPAQDDVQTGLLRLNDLIDGWKIEGLTVNTISRVIWPLTGASNYTVGTTGTVVIDRPPNASGLVFGYVDLTVSPAFEAEVDNYTEDEYQSIPFKTLRATYPTGFYYNPTSPLGTLTPYPIATGSNLQGVLYAPSPAGELALTDVLSLPAGYRRFYRDNLAVELAPDFAVQPSATLTQSAIDSKAAIKKANVRMTELVSEAGTLGGSSSAWNRSAFFGGG